MKDKIRDLITLQECDNRIQGLTDRQKEGPRKIQRLEGELHSVESEYQEEANRLELLKKERRSVEQEIQEQEEKLEKSNIKLAHIKSNKEYKAGLKEVDDVKKSKSSTEDKAIQLMEEIDELEKESLDNSKKLGELRKRFEEGKAEISKELESLEKELNLLQGKREKFVSTVDQELLNKYLFLKERKGGQAITPVIGAVCQACYMGLPPQKFNESIKGQSLLTCPNCDRIIYWGEDEHYKEAHDRV